MAISFKVGDTFSSYQEFKGRVEEFEKLNFAQFTHRHSRTLEAAVKREPKVVEKANKELVYCNIKLTCVFGGKKHKSEASSVRPNQKEVLTCPDNNSCRPGVKLVFKPHIIQYYTSGLLSVGQWFAVE